MAESLRGATSVAPARRTTITSPLLRLNLPPEMAQRLATHIIYVAIGLLVIVGLGWPAFNHVRASQAPATIKIGLVAPFEGLYRTTGYEVLFAVKLAVREWNQSQGVGGYRVELIALNDFNDPAEARRQARVLIADPGVMGVVGHLTSETTLAALPIYREARLAVAIPWSVAPAAFEDDDGEQRGIVSVAATTAETQAVLERLIRTMGVEQVALLDAAADLAQLPPASDAVRLATDAVTAGEILLALHDDEGALLPFGEVEVGNRQVVQVAGPAANGLLFVSPAPDGADIAGGNAFSEAYRAMAGVPPGPRAVLAYDAALVLLGSIELTMKFNEKWYNTVPHRGEISRAVRDVQRKGLTGDIAFDQHGNRRRAPVWIYQISKIEYPGTQIVP